MPSLYDSPPPLPVAHWIAATLLADAVAALIFVVWLYGPLFFGDAPLGAGALIDIFTPYVLGGLLPSFYLVWRTWRRRLSTNFAVYVGILMGLVLAVIMAVYASILTGESAMVYLVKIPTAQFFAVIMAGSLSGAAAWYYLDWVKGPRPPT